MYLITDPNLAKICNHYITVDWLR